ncbi:MAG: ATP-dependent zinc metalloprotease FtsH [Cytophagales bacterium]|nr:ATP-dependent zinc metalloprotease FtsH [Cytophagales bacterium]
MKKVGIKINLSWIICGVLVFFVVRNFFNSDTNVNISNKVFNVLLSNGWVDKVVCVRNTGVVYFNLTPEGAILFSQYIKNNKLFEEELQPSWKDSVLNFFGVKRRIMPFMMISSVDVFDRDFKSVQQNVSEEKKIGYEVVEHVSFLNVVRSIVSFITTFLFAYLIISQLGMLRGEESGGLGGLLGFGKTKARLFDKNRNDIITFKDVAGMVEVKKELQEVVDFLRSKKSISKIGGVIPRGVLLFGPPGNGKTLLARAVAGEANVPFFFISGSDFGSMFLGVAPARVRSVFKKAKEVAPAIVFIDEIDSIGKQRGRRFSSNDEQENTLNTLLTEMDGFEKNSGIIVMAATNRLELLDDALLRPGRFDRHVAVDSPTIKDREAILKMYIKKIRSDESIDINHLAEQTSGFSAAEIANICNEAALFAVRKKHDKVLWSDFQEAIDRAVLGVEKKSRIPSKEEKRIIAYHEAGHAVSSWFLKHSHPLLKVTIIPRGMAMGYARYSMKEIQYVKKKEEMLDDICRCLGGRVAEEVFFSTKTSGSVDDLERVCEKAYLIVSVYGMNDKVGSLSFFKYYRDRVGFEPRPYSEKTAEIIDSEVKKLVDECYNISKNLILEHKDKVKELAEKLLEKETIYKEDVEKILGKRPFENTEEDK